MTKFWQKTQDVVIDELTKRLDRPMTQTDIEASLKDYFDYDVVLRLKDKDETGLYDHDVHYDLGFNFALLRLEVWFDFYGQVLPDEKIHIKEIEFEILE